MALLVFLEPLEALEALELLELLGKLEFLVLLADLHQSAHLTQVAARAGRVTRLG